MNRYTSWFTRRVFRNQSGAVAIIVAFALPALVGVGGISVDAAYLYYAQRALQASTDAAALAGAQVIGTGASASSAVTTYSATGTLNANSSLTSAAVTATFKCFTSTKVPCSTNQTPSCSVTSSNCAGTSGANGVQVVQTAQVPTFFAKIFGISTVSISATATASARGGTATPLNVALILDTTASMGSAPTGPAATSCSSYSTAIACAVAGARTLLGELWPWQAGATSGNPVDEAALFVFPPVTNANQAATDVTCTNPQIAPSYSGLEGISANSTSTTLNLLPHTATVTGSISGTVLTVTRVTSGALSVGATLAGTGISTSHPPSISSFGTGTGGTGTYNLSASSTVASETITATNTTWGMQVSGSTNMTSTNAFNTGTAWAVVTDNTRSVISSGTGGYAWPWWENTGSTTISSVSTSTAPGSTTLSAAPTGSGIEGGDAIFVAPLYQIVGFANDYRTSDTASSLSTSSNIVKVTASGCLKTPGGLGTYYADAITAAQSALVTEQAARVAASQPGGQNVIVLLTDGNATSSSSQMGPLRSTSNECSAAVAPAQAAAAAGTTVYVVYYDDNGTGSTCTNDSGHYTGAAPNGACYTLQQIANSPITASPYYINDPTKFYSTDGTSSPCPSKNNYSSITAIFDNIVTSLQTARLIPNNTT